LDLDIPEIVEILEKNSDNFVLIKHEKIEESMANLTPKRFEAIRIKLDDYDFDLVIDDFCLTFAKDTNLVKDTLYKFIYKVVNNYILDFSKLLTKSKIDSESIKSYKDESDKEIDYDLVNLFLDWDNTKKNKFIFDIISYGLEYCIISNKLDVNRPELRNIISKKFYLDSNIIYRAIGINGSYRRELCEIFLKKCLSNNCTFNISSFTDVEFKTSIKRYIKTLSEFGKNKNLFSSEEITHQSDIFSYYTQWKIGKINPHIEIFESHINSLYQEFLKNYSVIIDQKSYSSSDKKEDEKIITNYSGRNFFL